MKKAYKFALILCIAGLSLGLSACTKPPVEIKSNDTSTSQLSLSNDARLITDVDGIMGKANVGTENGFYELKMRPDSGANITYIDYKTNAKIFLCNRVDCTHSKDDCTSFLSSSDVAGGAGLFSDNNYLYLMRLGKGAQSGSSESIAKDAASQIIQMDLNGDNKKCLVEFSGATTIWGGIAKDENTFYFLQDTIVQENGAPVVKRHMVSMDLQNGQITPLCEFSLDTYFVGVTHSGFIMKQIIGSDSGVTDKSLLLYRTATDTIEPVLQWNEDNIISQVYEGNVYYINPTKKVFIQINPDTKKETIVAENLPLSKDDRVIRQGIFDGQLKFQVYQHGKSTVDDIKYYSINLQTGALLENQLKYTAFNITSGVYILAENSTHFLVNNDKKLVIFDVTAPDGTISQMEGDEPVYSIIDKKDFWDNKPNFIPIIGNNAQ